MGDVIDLKAAAAALRAAGIVLDVPEPPLHRQMLCLIGALEYLMAQIRLRADNPADIRASADTAMGVCQVARVIAEAEQTR